MQEPVGSSVYQNDATSMTMTTVTTGRGESAMNYVSTDQKAIGQTRDLFVDLEKASGQSDSQSATFSVNQQTSKSKSTPQEDFLNENSKSSHIPLVSVTMSLMHVFGIYSDCHKIGETFCYLNESRYKMVYFRI